MPVCEIDLAGNLLDRTEVRQLAILRGLYGIPMVDAAKLTDPRFKKRLHVVERVAFDMHEESPRKDLGEELQIEVHMHRFHGERTRGLRFNSRQFPSQLRDGFRGHFRFIELAQLLARKETPPEIPKLVRSQSPLRFAHDRRKIKRTRKLP